MNRGSALDGAVQRKPRAGFNEAPIHESGKSSTCGARGRSGPGFNEAPIHESGKCGPSRPKRTSAAQLQ